MLVAKDSDLEQLVSDFSTAEAYALDTEFHGEGVYYPRLAVVQLAVPGRAVVIDATAVDPGLLRPLVTGSGIAVTHAGDQDFDILERACGARPARVFDTQVAAGFLGYGSASLASLVREFLGRPMDKGPRLSDWFQRPLSDAQIVYAEADVAHLLELRAVLESRLADRGRLDWAIDECERFVAPRPSDIATAWWRLKGSSSLRGVARGRAQELAAWREGAARAADRPARSILPDEALIAIAERPPRSANDMAKSRMFDPRRLSAATVGELIAAATRGAELAPREIRVPPDGLPFHLQGLTALIAAWVAQHARDLSIDPALLATRRDIEAFLQDEPNPRLNQGWRAEVIGESVTRIATGRAAVAYNGAGALVLVDR